MEYPLTFAQYNKALKKNILLGLKCKQCGMVTCPPQMRCHECSSPDLEKVELSGAGTIQTYTIIYVAAENRENEVPYIIVLVKLEEGPWLMGNLYDMDPDKVSLKIIGKKVLMGSRIYLGDKYSAGDAARPVFYYSG